MNALQQFEIASDAAFLANPLPHPNGYVAAWYLITVAEDSQRLMLALPEEPLPQWRVEHYQDRFKFSLRSCLARAQKETIDWTSTPLPERMSPKLYTAAQALLLSGIDYSVASQICSSAHSGSARVLEDSNGYRVEIVEDRLDKRYGALELMRQSAGDLIIPFSVLFWFWILEADQRPFVIGKIAESTCLRGRHVRYEYDPQLAYELSQAMPQAPFLAPTEWQFSWGGRHQTTLLLNALSLRLLYHLVAIQFGSARYKLRGGAEYDLCLVLTQDQWVADLELMTSLEIAHIREFVRQLTYGYGTQSPDQALQPFVPLGALRLGMGPLGWLSSNVERNLLSLQARLQPNELNRQSALFEKQMTESLATAFRKKWKNVAVNRTFTLVHGKEEIDILVCEPESKTVGVFELRWILPPADPREVLQKKQVCWQKVDQVQRKVLAVQNRLESVLKTAFRLTDVTSSQWTVRAIVVVEGFGGAASLDESVPLIPEWVLKAGTEADTTLIQLLDWIRSLTKL